MKRSIGVIRLSALIVVLALVAAGFGLFYPATGSPFSFTTIRGQTVQIWGQGWYRYDSPIAALSFRAGDLVTLVLAIPLLILSTLLYRRGSLRGGLLLAGTLAYFLYNYISVAFGAAYNDLFIVYVALLSASLYALLLALLSFDAPALPARFSARLPRRGIGIFLIVSGVILLLVWLLLSVLPALLAGQAPPEAYYYTTFVTGIVDMGIVAPALIAAGALLLRRAPGGYLLAGMMLAFTVVLGPSLIVAGIVQLSAGAISVGQAMAFTLPFAILTLFAVGYAIALFRDVSSSPLKP